MSTKESAIKMVKITKNRKKNGVNQYYVLYNDSKDNKGRWVNESEIVDQKLITQFLENEKDKRKYNKRQNSSGRRIQKIIGACYDDNLKSNFSFIVKFSDSNSQEKVSRNDMKCRYTKTYLSYLEENIILLNADNK